MSVIIPIREIEVALVVRDPNDDMILAYAIQQDAEFLISGDKDLLVLGDSFLPLKIRTPAAFLAELDAAK